MDEFKVTIESDSPIHGDLMFWSICGHEALSRPSSYELSVFSEKPSLDAKDVLGWAFDVVLKFDDKGERHFQGHAVRLVRVGAVNRFFEYRISLVSWFGLLKKRRNARIYQDQSVLEVFNRVADDEPISRFKKINSDGVIGTHDPRTYCVQFEESDYQFLSRLFEDEGIYYWFDSHDAPGTMRLTDAADTAHQKLPQGSTLSLALRGAQNARRTEIQRWFSSSRLDTGKFDARDSDFKAIRKTLGVPIDVHADHEMSEFEEFEFPGGYFKSDEAEREARIRGDELSSRRQRHWALTQWPDVAVGRSFSYEDELHTVDQGDYLIGACTFVVTHPGYEAMRPRREPSSIAPLLDAALGDDPVNAFTQEALRALIDGEPGLRHDQPGNMQFLLTLLPANLLYHPPRLTPAKRMPGPQSAIVVGPSGEELHVDEFGRVKVHFHWDRYDQSNEKSTCWLRVSQPWAGNGWGGYFAPRIGQEVIVEFLNGDPDRPLIMGRVYNDDQPIPFTSPTQSGFRTRSTPKGSAANCNEFRFEDKMGNEQVYLHAEKNLDIEVENDETHWVGHDRKKTIDNDETTHVKHDRTETVDNNETITIGVDRAEKVGSNETISIGVDRTETVGSNETITIGANRSITVGSNETATVAQQRTHTVGVNETIAIGAAQEIAIGAAQSVTVGAVQSISVGGNQSTDVGGNQSTDVGGNLSTQVGGAETRKVGKARQTDVGDADTLKVGKSLTIEAADAITLKTGSASITMKKDGTITIKGKDISLDGSGKINVKASSDVKIKGSKILQN